MILVKGKFPNRTEALFVLLSPMISQFTACHKFDKRNKCDCLCYHNMLTPKYVFHDLAQWYLICQKGFPNQLNIEHLIESIIYQAW